MTYRERPTSVPGAVLWTRTVGSAQERARILPDGCMDLLWDGRRLFVAGPDTTARWHATRAGTHYVALRFAGGTGPAFLGIPADELKDRTPDLEEVWAPGEAQVLSERVEADPVGALESWVGERAATRPVDPLGTQILKMAATGTGVAVMADEVGLSTRQLHRRCLPLFGYGPRLLARVLRIGRAVDAVRAGASLAEAAATCDYADQAHLAREVRALAGTTPTRLLTERPL